MAKLKENTVVVDEAGAARPLAAGDEVPKWAIKQVGDHLLEESKPSRSSRRSSGSGAGVDSGSGIPDEPPRGGEGATAEAWRAYAVALDIEVPEGAGRDDIIALVDAR